MFWLKNKKINFQLHTLNIIIWIQSLRVCSHCQETGFIFFLIILGFCGLHVACNRIMVLVSDYHDYRSSLIL